MGKRTKRILALLLSLCLCMQYAVAFEGKLCRETVPSPAPRSIRRTPPPQDTTGGQRSRRRTGEGTGETTETTPDSSGDTASGTESDGTQPTGSDSAPTGGGSCQRGILTERAKRRPNPLTRAPKAEPIPTPPGMMPREIPVTPPLLRTPLPAAPGRREHP